MLRNSWACVTRSAAATRRASGRCWKSWPWCREDGPLVFHEVTPELVRGIVSEWTGIPEAKLGGAEAGNLARLGEALRRRVRGQDHALEAIERAVLAAQVGLNSESKPTGIFLLVGPSGVGKTETALAVADALFGGERNLVCINMSEFQEKHTVSRLIGSPPGYVGYGEGGRLTEGRAQTTLLHRALR